ncbi:MAG: hypothetical protein GEU73_16660, partial [Chloroflexi bacterium]|nr:hypothetical protein [Chloroflexota bacterium]
MTASAEPISSPRPTIGLLFYRSHLLSGNADFVDAIIRVAESRGANVLAVYT